MQHEDELLFSQPLIRNQAFQVDLLLDDQENQPELMATGLQNKKYSENYKNQPAQEAEEVILRSLLCERQQMNIQFPDKPYQEEGQYDLRQFGSSLPKALTEPSPNKKINKNPKNVYLDESRQDKINRYLQKKRTRMWKKKVSYDCRKVVADNRERVNGRFVKKSPCFKAQHKNSLATLELEGGRQQKNGSVEKIEELGEFCL